MNSQRIAVVTGGAGGIGKEISRHFLEAGIAVMIADRDETAGKRALEELGTDNSSLRFMKADIARPEEVAALMSFTAENLGGIDILVNNAGFGIRKSPDILTLEEWDQVLNTNLRGAFVCAREAANHMKKRGGGSIINIASTRAIMSEPDSEAYAASKGGMISLTHALAASYSPHKIRINCISPGWIETGDYSRLRESDHAQHFSGRVGRPSDIAGACLFLVENDFINGSNIIIDGGMTRKMIYVD